MQVKYCYDESGDSERSSDWKEHTGLTMEIAMLHGSSHNSSKRRETKKVDFNIEGWEIASTETAVDIFVLIVGECSSFSNSISTEMDCEYSTSSREK